MSHDTKYMHWLKFYHPEAVISPDSGCSISTLEKTSTTPTPQSQPTPLTPHRDSVKLNQLSCMSKYLTTPHSRSASTKPAPKARLLTSADALAILEEKERK